MWSASEDRGLGGGLWFGTAGVPNSTVGTSSLAGIQRVVDLGLDCMEVEFVKGVKMGAETAEKIAEKAKELGRSWG